MLHDIEGGVGLLAIHESVEPGDEEEDFALALDVGEGCERQLEVPGGEGGVVPVIESAEGGLDPVFADFGALARFRSRGVAAVAAK